MVDIRTSPFKYDIPSMTMEDCLRAWSYFPRWYIIAIFANKVNELDEISKKIYERIDLLNSIE